MIEKTANILTGSRIIGSILLLFCTVFSTSFYIIYLFCGFTDLIDGTVARKTNSISSFGSRFDSAADFIFAVIALFKILPAINIPFFVWIWIGVIFAIKIFNIIYGFMRDGKYAALHTKMNKVTGLLLFIFPLTLPFIEITYPAVIICIIATYAAVEEGYYIKNRKVIT